MVGCPKRPKTGFLFVPGAVQEKPSVGPSQDVQNSRYKGTAYSYMLDIFYPLEGTKLSRNTQPLPIFFFKLMTRISSESGTLFGKLFKNVNQEPRRVSIHERNFCFESRDTATLIKPPTIPLQKERPFSSSKVK